MTERVYITGGGERWHSRSDCEALLNGQDEARKKGFAVHQTRRVALDDIGERHACAHCVQTFTLADGLPTTKVTSSDTETNYELAFLEQVLNRLPELADWTVSAQQVLRVGGQTYRPDFTVVNGPSRIAVEIDGFDKGPDAPTHAAVTRRQRALVTEGWEVIRFSNREVMHDPDECRRQLSMALSRLSERERRSSIHISHVGTDSEATQTHERSKRAWVLACGALVTTAAVVGVILITVGGGSGRTAPETLTSCPASHPLKGNGESRIVHSPRDEFYAVTEPEDCFRSLSDAVEQGYRAARR